MERAKDKTKNKQTRNPVQRNGVRKRVHDAVKQALTEAALDAFSGQSFDQVKIDMITDAVGVSARTFFRYFPSKESVVCEWIENLSAAACERLRERPESENPFESLLIAFEAFSDIDSHMEQHVRLCDELRKTSPSLDAWILHREGIWRDRLTDVIGERTGIDPRKSIYPALIANIGYTALRVTEEWGNSRKKRRTQKEIYALLRQIMLALTTTHPELLRIAMQDSYSTDRLKQPLEAAKKRLERRSPN